MVCEGVENCSKKNCLEQERCVSWVLPSEIKNRPKKKKHKRTNNAKCQFPKLSCRKYDVCVILGECVLEHKLVLDNPEIRERIKDTKSILTILKIFTRLNPPKSLNKNRIINKT